MTLTGDFSFSSVKRHVLFSTTATAFLFVLLGSKTVDNVNAAPPFDVFGTLYGEENETSETGFSGAGSFPGSPSLAQQFIKDICGSSSRTLHPPVTFPYGNRRQLGGYGKTSKGGPRGSSRAKSHKGSRKSKKDSSCSCQDTVVRFRASDLIFESGLCTFLFEGERPGDIPEGPFPPEEIPENVIGYRCSAPAYGPCAERVIGQYEDYAIRTADDGLVFLGSGTYTFHNGETTIYTRYRNDLGDRIPPQFNPLVGGTGRAAALNVGQEIQLGFILDDDGDKHEGDDDEFNGFFNVLLYTCNDELDLPNDPKIVDAIFPFAYDDVPCNAYPCF